MKKLFVIVLCMFLALAVYADYTPNFASSEPQKAQTEVKLEVQDYCSFAQQDRDIANGEVEEYDSVTLDFDPEVHWDHNRSHLRNAIQGCTVDANFTVRANSEVAFSGEFINEEYNDPSTIYAQQINNDWKRLYVKADGFDTGNYSEDNPIFDVAVTFSLKNGNDNNDSESFPDWVYIPASDELGSTVYSITVSPASN